MQHFAESVVQPLGDLQFSFARLKGCLGIGLVRVIPNVVSNESLHVADGAFGEGLFLGFAQLPNEALYIFDKNVISSDHDLLLLRLLHFIKLFCASGGLVLLVLSHLLLLENRCQGLAFRRVRSHGRGTASDRSRRCVGVLGLTSSSSLAKCLFVCFRGLLISRNLR